MKGCRGDDAEVNAAEIVGGAVAEDVYGVRAREQLGGSMSQSRSY